VQSRVELSVERLLASVEVSATHLPK
jgi:hypothetical protein